MAIGVTEHSTDAILKMRKFPKWIPTNDSHDSPPQVLSSICQQTWHDLPLVGCLRVLCVDDLSLFHIRASTVPAILGRVGTLTALRTAIQLLRQALRNVLELIHRLLDCREIFSFRSPTRLGNSRFDSRCIGVWHLTAVFVDRLLNLIRKRVSLVTSLDQVAPRLVLGRVAFGLLHQSADVFLRQSTRAGDGDFLFLACGHVLRRYVHDSVRINIEAHLNLRNAPWRRW